MHGQHISQMSLWTSDSCQMITSKFLLYKNLEVVTGCIIFIGTPSSHKHFMLLQMLAENEKNKSGYVLFVLAYYLNYDKTVKL